MQVVVPSAPSSGTDSTIHGVYDDSQIVPLDSLPQGAVLLRFIQSQYIYGGVWPPTLKKEWIQDLPNIAASEASRRVEICYSASQQRAAALLLQNDMMAYGNDSALWPAAEQTRYAEVQRGLAYINAMNAAQQTIVAQGILDPCNDQYWPAPIAPISL